MDSILQEPEFVALYSQQSDLHARAARELAPVVLLGPAAVSAAVLEMQEAYERSDDEAAGRAEVAFRDAARSALKIEGAWLSTVRGATSATAPPRPGQARQDTSR